MRVVLDTSVVVAGLRSREIHLATRPVGEPVEANFALVDAEVRPPGDGDVLVRNSFVSVDPYMRGRMNDAPSYLPPFVVGAVMDGGAVGAALANRDRGRFTVTFQPDGDLMYAPGVLWTAAHHKIPILFVMHNNRAYHQEVMHLQRMAALHDRRPDQAGIGNAIDNPNIDYAKLAQAHGVWGEGPITDPAKLSAALKRAVAVVKDGAPALLDVVCQAR